MAKKVKRKHSEKWWAIRIGNFANSMPFYLRSRDGGIKTFETRTIAQAHKKQEGVDGGGWLTADWAVVRVDVKER